MTTVVMCGVAAMAVLGLVQQTGVLPVRGFHPKGENNVFALWSGGLLAAAAAASWLLGIRADRARRRFYAFGVALAALSVDEVLGVHERLEETLGVDWQLLYAPVALLGGGLFLSLLPALGGTGGRRWVLLAPPAWFVAQAFEFLQWHDDTMLHPWMVYPEEVLEMVGSSMLLIGLYASLHQLSLIADRRRPTWVPARSAGRTSTDDHVRGGDVEPYLRPRVGSLVDSLAVGHGVDADGRQPEHDVGGGVEQFTHGREGLGGPVGSKERHEVG